MLVNFYDDESLPAGLTLEIANGVVGTGNPDVADVVAAISDEWFYTIISPWSDSANMAIIEPSSTAGLVEWTCAPATYSPAWLARTPSSPPTDRHATTSTARSSA